MDIDDASWKCLERRCMQHAHESSENYQVNMGLA
jgi:hypothetical protein